MAFSYTTDVQFIPGGGFKQVSGTYTNTGVTTGGDIKTGLNTCYHIFLQPGSSAVETDVPVPSSTFPVTGGVVTIVTVAGGDGHWCAQGI